MSDTDLLPQNATPWERAMSRTMDRSAVLNPPVTTLRGAKLLMPPNSFLPALQYEYAAGLIARFFQDDREALSQAIQWVRVRGTQAAITRALDWIDYDGQVEAFPTRRKRWNLFMLALNRLRDQEEPDLENIEYLARVSVPLRSRFWRGFYGYDIRALEFSRTKWGRTNYSTFSGARIRQGGAKWSFGRTVERDYTPSQSDLTALGVYTAPSGSALTWGAFTWSNANVSWNSSAPAVRSRLMASGVLAKTVWICFKNAQGGVIGYRRARVWRGVAASLAGPYFIGAQGYAPADDATVLYVEALTDFGDGYGSTAASWSLVFNPTIVAPAPIGLLWAQPAQLSGGVTIMPTACTIEFGRTIRERVRAILRF